MKNQNGITLIALVITIIVLLILAGVAIAMLSGDNGILNKASDAAKDSAVSSAKEQIGLVVNEAITNYYDSVYVDGNKDNQAKGVQVAVVNAVAAISDNYDDITFAKPTALNEKQPENTTITFTITYNGDGDIFTGSIANDGKLSWDK